MNDKLKIVQIVQTVQRGRPPVDILWPNIAFTAQDVADLQQKKVSRVTIHSKLNKAVDKGELKIVGKLKKRNGRPRISYEKNSACVVPLTPDNTF